MSDTVANVIGICIAVCFFAFAIGHIVGYWRGKGRVTCPLCKGRGFVAAKGPTINQEKEVFEAGFQAGMREGRVTFRGANPTEDEARAGKDGDA